MSISVTYPAKSELPAVNENRGGGGMPGLTWEEAAGLLLNAVGYRDDISANATLPQLATSLRGSGFNLARTPIVNGIVSAAEGKVGMLLEIDDGHWLAVLGDGEDAVLLSPTGSAVVSNAVLAQQGIVSAWVMTEHIISMGSAAPFLHRYKSYFLDLFVAAIIVNLFALTLPLFSSFVYDKILGNGIVETLWALVIGLMIVAGLEFCVRMVRIAVAERFAVESEVEIDQATFRNLLDTHANKMPSLGGLLEKYKQILSFRDFLSSSYLLAIADLPFLLLFLAVIAIVAGPLVFVPLVCGSLMMLVQLTVMGPVLTYDRAARGGSERRFGLMTDLLTSREAIIGSALPNKLSERWRHASVAAVQAASKARYWRGLGMTISSSLSTISFVGILTGGVYMVEAHSLTSGGLLAASMLTSRTMAVFASVNTLLLRYREFRTALRELNQLVPAAPRLAAPRLAAQASHGRLHGAIRIDHVSCRLRASDAPVLGDISLNINAGEIVGIAGAPGAGKTTLLRLLAGVVSPDEGRILIDNIPLEQLTRDDISQTIGFKPQDCCLLDGTIEENVRAGRAALTPEMRRDVLTMSGLQRVFDEGTLNWTTEVGARGSHLSGGQRQLVSLARAFLTHAPVLLLDEPTNGLDAALEAHLAGQLSAMRGRSTVLVSTHSRNTLMICDRIIVIGQGGILANGPRDQILT